MTSPPMEREDLAVFVNVVVEPLSVLGRIPCSTASMLAPRVVMDSGRSREDGADRVELRHRRGFNRALFFERVGYLDGPMGCAARSPCGTRRRSARNHSAIPSMCGSKSPGTETLSAPVRSAVRFSKSCAVPPGALTSEPFGTWIDAPPTKKFIVPAITKKTSSSSCVSGMEVYEAVTKIALSQAGCFVFLTGGAFTPAAQAFLDRAFVRERLEHRAHERRT
jgi:hypothetical protein